MGAHELRFRRDETTSLEVDVADLEDGSSSEWSEPRIVSAAVVEAGWRIVFTVADDVGNRWPLSMVVPS